MSLYRVVFVWAPRARCNQIVSSAPLTVARALSSVNNPNPFASPRAQKQKRYLGLSQERQFRSSTAHLAANKDLYATLGVAKDASAADIKKAYYKLAKKYHPDSNPGESARQEFQQIQTAYETLSDPQKREQYDQFGVHGDQQQGFGGQGDFRGGFGGFSGGFGGDGPNGFGGGGFEEIFENFFRNESQQESAGTNVQMNVKLSFMEAAKGITKTVDFNAISKCPPCSGTGAKPGSKPKVCSRCGGSGKEVTSTGFFTVAQTCRSCHGAGHIIVDKCSTCKGKGRIQEKKTVKVEFPAGIDDGMTLRVPGAGNVGDHGAPGHLFVKVGVEESNVFKRKGPDLYVDVPLTLDKAILGGVVQVPTLDGNIEIKLQRGTQPGDSQRLRGRGLPDLQKQTTGHQYLNFKVQLPTQLNDAQAEAFDRFMATLDPTRVSAKKQPQPQQQPQQQQQTPPSSSNTTSDTKTETKKDHDNNDKKSIFSKISEAFTKKTDKEPDKDEDIKSGTA